MGFWVFLRANSLRPSSLAKDRKFSLKRPETGSRDPNIRDLRHWKAITATRHMYHVAGAASWCQALYLLACCWACLLQTMTRIPTVGLSWSRWSSPADGTLGANARVTTAPRRSESITWSRNQSAGAGAPPWRTYRQTYPRTWGACEYHECTVFVYTFDIRWERGFMGPFATMLCAWSAKSHTNEPLWFNDCNMCQICFIFEIIIMCLLPLCNLEETW